jgi:flagellar biosynthesis protein FlhF
VRDGATELDARLAALGERIEERLAVPRFDLPRSQLVIGAPGVGKTTSLAKLADRYPAGPLTLVSTDVCRPGASARLHAFAADLGVPCEEVRCARDLPLGSLRRGPVLVDTAGWDASSAAPLVDLDPLRRALGAQADVQLVVSATTREADLERQLRSSAALEPSSLIVTRVDETRDLSNIVNVLLQPGTPRLAWLGCGQGVPDDLALPDAHELAATLLGAAA